MSDEIRRSPAEVAQQLAKIRKRNDSGDYYEFSYSTADEVSFLLDTIDALTADLAERDDVIAVQRLAIEKAAALKTDLQAERDALRARVRELEAAKTNPKGTFERSLLDNSPSPVEGGQ